MEIWKKEDKVLQVSCEFDISDIIGDAVGELDDALQFSAGTK